MGEIKLPTQKIKATQQSPKNLIIFAKPKVGKTSLLAELENCLILDLEEGSDYVNAMKLKATVFMENIPQLCIQVICRMSLF